MLDVARIKGDFPALDREVNGHRITYLDSAASSQKPRQVIDAMSRYYETTHANVHRGVYTTAAEATELYEGARRKVARFINAPSPDEVLFGKNVTEAINLVAKTWGRFNVKKGDAIVLTVMDHHANLVPWQMLATESGATLRHLGITADGQLDLSNLDEVLDGAKVLAVTSTSNVLGTINDVTRLTEAARRHGAISVVDAAQWTPHIRTDVQAFGADFVGITGHKMFGPTGVGVLWGRRTLLEEMPPFLGGGDMIVDVRIDGFDVNEIPHKFEAGTPPIAEVIGLGAAVDYLENVGMANVRAHEVALTGYAMGRLRERFGDRITMHGPENPDARVGVVSFALDGVHPHDVSQVLDTRGVCVRAGHHCAKPLMRELGVGATARASFHIYNDEADVETLCEAIDTTFEFFS